MIVIVIAFVQEVPDAVFQGLEWSFDGEELVPGDRVVVRMPIQIAPLPHRRIAPPLRLVQLKRKKLTIKSSSTVTGLEPAILRSEV